MLLTGRIASAAGSSAVSTACATFTTKGWSWALRRRFLTLLVSIALIVLTAYLYVVIPKGFVPEQDTGIFIGVAQAREDIAFDAMAKIENECAAIILKDPAVSGVVGFAGATGGNPSESQARMFAQLKPLNERPSVQDVMARLRPERAKLVGVKSSCNRCRTSELERGSSRRNTNTP